MNVDLSKSSVVQWFRETEKRRCGYCKNESSISNGMWAESLTVEDYQDLIDRGWRRSGKYCYKSIMDKTCCPLYTIKCDAVNFSLSKSQKKVIKKFNKFLKDGEINNKDNPSGGQFFDEPESCSQLLKEHPEINLSNISTNITDTVIGSNVMSTEESSIAKVDEEVHNANKGKCELLEEKLQGTRDNVNDSSQVRSNAKTTFKEGVGADPNKPPCKKAKILRIERKKEKLLPVQKNPIGVQNKKSLEEFLEEVVSEEDKKKLIICLVSTSEPNSKWIEGEDVEFELYKKYQMIIHNDPPSKLTLSGFKRFLVKSPLKITVERMSASCNTFNSSADLYKKYQIHIHNDPPDECDEEQFYNFLVETPLQPKSFPEGVKGPGYGSFHQQYWLNDKLIAVGVIDILPKCVSSVYFFYDPDYRSLTLGTYGSLREVQLARQLQKTLPDLSNYYMGFYIHSCPKMRYKGNLTPSYLVCPESYCWVPIEKCVPLLEANKYSRLNEDIDAIDTNYVTEEDILKIKIVYKYRLMRYGDFRSLVDESEKFLEIGNLVGKKCSRNLIFWEQ